MTNLFISLYHEKDKQRAKEFRECLRRNSEIFDYIFVLAEICEEVGFDYLNPLPDNVNILPVTIRPTFRTFFNAINTVNQEGDTNVIANSDIYFENLVSPQFGQCFALTRWEPTHFLNRNDSQDSWWFTGPIRMPKYCDYWIGVPGCDNRLALELKLAGYEVLNPSLDIKTYHLHKNGTDHTNSPRRVNGPYLKLNPCTL